MARAMTDAELHEANFYAWTKVLPAVNPYALDQLLDDDWYPANRHGVRD